jgi:hypothetical protein
MPTKLSIFSKEGTDMAKWNLGNPCKELWYEQRIKELEAKLAGAIAECERIGRLWHDAEAKLEKAVEALERIDSIMVHSGGEIHGVTAQHWRTAFEVAQDEATITLAELKGQGDD